MSEVIRVTGLTELNRAMAKLADDVQKKYLRGAVAAGARLIKDAAVRNVETIDITSSTKNAVDTGRLKKAIYSKWLQKESTADHIVFFVSVLHGPKYGSKMRKNGNMSKSRDAYYWWWIENGHIATGPGGKILGGERRREAARKALHAAGHFVPPRPFLRPAFESNKQNAIEAVRAELSKRILEGIKK